MLKLYDFERSKSCGRVRVLLSPHGMDLSAFSNARNGFRRVQAAHGHIALDGLPAP